MTRRESPDPANAAPDAVLEQAQALLDRLLQELGSSAEGRAMLASVEPAQVDADYERAWRLMADGDMIGATDAFGELAQRVPDQHRIQFAFALCLQHHGLVDEAMRHYSLAFILDPSQAACAYRMGECLFATRALEAAREAMLTAIELSAIEGNDPDIATYAQQALDEWAAS